MSGMDTRSIPAPGASWPVAPRRRDRARRAGSRRRGAALLLRLLLALGFLGVLAIWASTTAAGFAASPVELATALSELAGLVASYLVCVQLLLIARIPWFEAAVGLDRLVGWHRVVGPSVLILVCLHVILIVAATGLPAHAATPWGALLVTLHSYSDMLPALVGGIALIAIGMSCLRWVRSRLSYELWYALHVTAYVAVFLTFLHQLSAGPAFLDSPFYRLLWLGLYLGTASAVVTWRVVLAGWDAWRHRMRVAAVVPEADGVLSVWLRVRRLEDRDIRAGMFLVFRFLAWGHLLSAHPYSISQAPTQGHIRITVAALGDHSRALRRLKVGTLVLAEGPYGHFTADRMTRSRALLVAGCAGIGPICALAKDLAATGADVVVVYRARSADRLALANELAQTPGVRLIPMVGSRAALGVDPLAPRELTAAVPDAAIREAFVCGPPGMVSRTRSSLRRLGIASRHIHTDELSIS